MAAQYQLEETTEAYSKIKHTFSRKILDKLESYIPGESHVLEVGPGAGHFARECVKRGYKYIAIDSSHVIRDKLKEMGIDVLDATIPPIPMEEKTVDLFFASMVLEHMPTYIDAIGFIEEGKRVLKPNGIICLTFPNAYPNGKIFWEMDYTHSYFTTPRRVVQLCKHLGLDVIEVQKSIGWFWVHSTPLHDILRHITNLFAGIINNSLIAGVLENIGLGGVLWKFRKTFFESAIVLAKKSVQEK